MKAKTDNEPNYYPPLIRSATPGYSLKGRYTRTLTLTHTRTCCKTSKEKQTFFSLFILRFFFFLPPSCTIQKGKKGSVSTHTHTNSCLFFLTFTKTDDDASKLIEPVEAVGDVGGMPASKCWCSIKINDTLLFSGFGCVRILFPGVSAREGSTFEGFISSFKLANVRLNVY